MGMQISLKLPDKLYQESKKYVESYGYENVQEFIRTILRERLFEKESFSTYLASERSLAKEWLSKEEDEAWAHLQKET